MPAPTGRNALERIFALLAVPSAFLVVALPVAYSYYGAMGAGLVLNLTTLFMVVSVAAGATFWNIEYTALFALGGTVLFIIWPSAFSPLVHPALEVVNRIIVLGFLVYVWAVLFGKLGFNVPGGL